MLAFVVVLVGSLLALAPSFEAATVGVGALPSQVSVAAIG